MARLVVGPVKWTGRWIARAQRKADLRAERFLRHEEGVRAGTEPPGFLERIEYRNSSFLERIELRSARNQSCVRRGYVNSGWPFDARPYDASLRLADAWLTWVGHGPVCGPDGVEVTIWIRSAGQDLPFRYTPDDQVWLTRQELAASRNDYTVCVRRMPAGPAKSIRSFPIETSALVRGRVRQAGTASRHHRTAAIRHSPGPPPPGRRH